MKENHLPTAAEISIVETIGLLEGKFKEFAEGFDVGEYALWLGSGISRERVVGLDGVLTKLIEALRQRMTNTVDCLHYKALCDVLALAELLPEERKEIDFDLPAKGWPRIELIVNRLWGKYSEVLGISIKDQKLDYLLWDVLDFKNTFSSQEPDAEHLAIGMLVLEGVVSQLATANWDSLLEAAMLKLGQPQYGYKVAVTGSDLKGPAASATLYKFHGCARRAVEAEGVYRQLLVARQSAINQWAKNKDFEEIRNQLTALIAKSRTLMIGLSAQDSNIQLMFGANGWKWNEKPAPIVFSAQELSPGQKSILEGAYYPDYEDNRDQICASATFPAYSKALLLALLLKTITNKIEVLINHLTCAGLDDVGKVALVSGIRELRNKVALHGDGDRFKLACTIANLMGRFAEQFLGGQSKPGSRPYIPTYPKMTHQMALDPALKFSAQLHAAATLGLIGLEARDNKWNVSVDDPTEENCGALTISVQNASARVFFASSDDKISGLIKSGAFHHEDDDVVVICSTAITPNQQRSPSASLRSGRMQPRYVGVEEVLDSAASLDEIRSRFVGEVGL